MIKQIYYRLRHLLTDPEERGGQSAGYWHVKIRKEVVSLRDFSHEHILDVGCGEGLLIKRYADTHPQARLWGLDVVLPQLLRARAHIGSNPASRRLVQASAFKIPFKERTFDTVVCINFIVNVPSNELLEALFTELARVLKPQGRIIFDIRNSNNLFVRLKYKFAHFYDGTLAGVHLKTYKRSWITRKLASFGLVVLQTKAEGFFRGGLSSVIVIEARKI